jgi:hypothetical protein
MLPMMVTFGTYPNYERLQDGDYPDIAWNLGAGSFCCCLGFDTHIHT